MNDAFDKIQSEGFIEQIVRAKLEETIKSIIDGLFRSYSDFGKGLEKKLGEKIAVNLGNIDLPKYNIMLENYIKEQTTTVMNEQHKKLIDERLSDILKKEEKREWKLSDIVQEIVDENEEAAEENDWEKPSFHIDGQGCKPGLTFIRIDPEPDKEKYQCCFDICLDNESGKIHSAEVGEYESKDFRRDKFLIYLHGVEALIFRLYSQGCVITTDVEQCENICYPEI